MRLEETRAVRNNNPGNLEDSVPWQGMLPFAQRSPAQKKEGRFAVFREPKWGFRALAILLRTYSATHGLRTIRGIINRFAPPAENDTGAYVKAVSQMVGADPDATLDLDDKDIVSKLCRAIAVHESGGWFFKPEDLYAGVNLAFHNGKDR